MYHGDAARTGDDTTGPALLPLRVAWHAGLDGNVYAQPLVVAGRVIVVTENDSVYALDAHNGRVLWRRQVGRPVTNVAAQVGCGNIDPLGITSTPVINQVLNRVYVVAAVQDATDRIHHQLVGLDLTTGAVKLSVNADPGGPQDPLYIQQRAGLANGNARVYIGYGGYFGDCGPYHGWLVSFDLSGHHKVAFDVTPHDGFGAIWEPGGPAIDANGNVFVGTGNNDPHVATHDYGESVLKFNPTLGLLGNFSNSNVSGDGDFGTTTPALVGADMVFEIGKQNVGYLLDAGNLHELQQLTVCPTSEAKGADAFDGTHLYVPCDAGIQEVNIDNNAPVDVARLDRAGHRERGTAAAGRRCTVVRRFRQRPAVGPQPGNRCCYAGFPDRYGVDAAFRGAVRCAGTPAHRHRQRRPRPRWTVRIAAAHALTCRSDPLAEPSRTPRVAKPTSTHDNLSAASIVRELAPITSAPPCRRTSGRQHPLHVFPSDGGDGPEGRRALSADAAPPDVPGGARSSAHVPCAGCTAWRGRPRVGEGRGDDAGRPRFSARWLRPCRPPRRLT